VLALKTPQPVIFVERKTKHPIIYWFVKPSKMFMKKLENLAPLQKKCFLKSTGTSEASTIENKY